MVVVDGSNYFQVAKLTGTAGEASGYNSEQHQGGRACRRDVLEDPPEYRGRNPSRTVFVPMYQGVLLFLYVGGGG